MKILSNREAYPCDNVMPSVNKLNIEPARQKIREIFLERIVHAKGLDKASKLIGGVLMPTPSAVLMAAELLAADIGDLIAIDVGGATTDVYSIADGEPRSANVVFRGLPEPFAKRTVEGDIGMRYSAHGIAEAVGIPCIAKMSGLSEETVLQQIVHITKHPGALPETEELKAVDLALAAIAIEMATMHHAGSLEEVYTPTGQTFIQTGKDLTNVKKILMTGGALIHAQRQKELASFALYNEKQPQSLRPTEAELLVDKHYIIAAMGLLSGYAPDAALEIMKSNVQEL
jgi:uncharacterized protein (TIGR01319 family)